MGLLCSLASMLPYLVIVDQASKLYSQRDIKNLLILSGLVVNEALAITLKKIVKQPRPLEKCELLDTCDSYGWPSSHTQCIFFYLGLHLCLTILTRPQALGNKWAKPGRADSLISLLETTILTCSSFLVGFSRYYLSYHTLQQVFVGALIGLLFSLVWSSLVMTAAVERWLLAIIPFSSSLRVKSSMNVPQHELLEMERSFLSEINEENTKNR